MTYRCGTMLVEAVQWQPGMTVPGVCVAGRFCSFAPSPDGPHVHTIEGLLTVSPGDWIAGPGTRGEFWPIKPDVFAATYVAADNDDKCPPATTARLTEELAAAQATITRLRESATRYLGESEHAQGCFGGMPGTETCSCGREALRIALALPHDRAALDAALARARAEVAARLIAAAHETVAGLLGVSNASVVFRATTDAADTIATGWREVGP